MVLVRYWCHKYQLDLYLPTTTTNSILVVYLFVGNSRLCIYARAYIFISCLFIDLCNICMQVKLLLYIFFIYLTLHFLFIFIFVVVYRYFICSHVCEWICILPLLMHNNLYLYVSFACLFSLVVAHIPYRMNIHNRMYMHLYICHIALCKYVHMFISSVNFSVWLKNLHAPPLPAPFLYYTCIYQNSNFTHSLFGFPSRRYLHFFSLFYCLLRFNPQTTNV